jgi:predicted GNAT family N-acyltransferase
MTFREITFGSPDYRQECELRQVVLRNPIGLNIYDEDLEKERDHRHFGLFDAAGVLAACAVATPLSDDTVRIRQMAVASDSQGQGLGRTLMVEIERWLAEHGFTCVTLHARASAVGFYEKLGYAITSEEFVEVTIVHRMMEKTLVAG